MNHTFMGSLCVLAVLFTMPVKAGLIETLTLDDIPNNFRFQNLPSYDEAGFNVSVNLTNKVNLFANTGVTWGADGKFLETWNTQAIFIIKETSDQLFNFLGLDVGWYNNDVQQAMWDIRAYDETGTLLETRQISDSGHVALGFTGISELHIQQSSVGASSFDNLLVSLFEPPQTAPAVVPPASQQVTSIPEPTAITLWMLSALVLFEKIKRRN